MMNRIRSYDIFDTLIARRCIDPRNIFIEVEQASQRPGFAAGRSQAEALLYAAGPYDLDAIYLKLQELLSLSDSERDDLKTLEIEREVANDRCVNSRWNPTVTPNPVRMPTTARLTIACIASP